MSNRGELTNEIQEFTQEFLGRDICVRELRLYPYLAYQMMNDRILDPRRINQDERKILTRLKAAGHIEGGAGGLRMTHEFWRFINNVLWVSHCNYDGDGLC